jgi:signal transduction histidine kinase
VDISPALRRKWPLALLLVSLALTALAALDAHRAVASQDATVARAMREFSSFAAWSYGQNLEDRLNAMLREALGAVNHGDNVHEQPPVPKAYHLATYLPYDSRCDCHRTRFGPNPAHLFAFYLGGDSLDVAHNTYANPPDGWEVDHRGGRTLAAGAAPTYSRADRRWILDTITNQVQSSRRPPRGFTLIVAPRVVGYTLMPTSWGDTLVYGVEYTRKDFEQVLAGLLDREGLLPATFIGTRQNRDVVVARVRGSDSSMLLDSDPGVTSVHAARLALPKQLGGMSYEVFVRPEQASAVVFGGLPKSHLPFLLGVLGLAAALSVVAVFQIRREMELVRMRSDFVSSVSHELRTPLAQIRLFTETLRFGRAQTPEQRAWSLGHIERETTRLGMLIDNVLRFGRAGRSDPTRATPTDIAAEARRIVEEFRPLAASRNANVIAQIESTPSVPLRPDALRRLLLNLLDNAVKFGPAGQRVAVTVSAVGGDVVIAVSDQGPGVPRAEREMIWQAFKRGSAATIAAGSGIGLSVIREIAHEHGGRAWVEDAPGGGARFIVSLPVAAANGNGA